LGLPLARKVIETHGGELKIDSSEAGTTITVRLPQSKAAQK
jgi:signal transduction histidine kinase